MQKRTFISGVTSDINLKCIENTFMAVNPTQPRTFHTKRCKNPRITSYFNKAIFQTRYVRIKPIQVLL